MAATWRRISDIGTWLGNCSQRRRDKPDRRCERQRFVTIASFAAGPLFAPPPGCNVWVLLVMRRAWRPAPDSCGRACAAQGLVVVGAAPANTLVRTRELTEAMEEAGLIHHGSLLEMQFP